MANLRLSFILLLTLGFLCAVNSNPLSLFGKSSDDKVETDEKSDVTTGSTVKSGETTTTTTTTQGPSTSCGGLKGFLHICDKNEPTEPAKTVKTRSVDEKDDDSDESDSNEDDDSEESEEDKEKKATESSSTASEPTESAVVKRQVGDPDAPVVGEVPSVLEDAMSPPVEPEENSEASGMPERRQAEDPDDEQTEETTTDEVEEDSRKRRDCRDYGDSEGKNCRRKRELVPTCTGSGCKFNETKLQ